MSDNYALTKAGRQSVLRAVVRFDGDDVTAAPVAGTGVEIEMPPNVIVLSTDIVTITADGEAGGTFDVGTVADEDGYGSELVVGATGTAAKTAAGALIGTFVAEATNIYVSEGAVTTDNVGDHVLIIEYVQVGRSTEVYG